VRLYPVDDDPCRYRFVSGGLVHDLVFQLDDSGRARYLCMVEEIGHLRAGRLPPAHPLRLLGRLARLRPTARVSSG
jgi:hypothetical protein